MKQNTPIIAAVIIGLSMVASAVIITERGPTNTTYQPDPNAPSVGEQPGAVALENAPSPFRDGDRWRYGSPEAETVIVEFSDFECPFCSRVHPTLERLVDESNGTIAWEYRHLPLPFHTNADEAAIASECVGRFAGNDAFWSYGATIFENYRSISNEFLRTEAIAVGVAPSDYDSCIVDEAIAAIVAEDTRVAQALGGSGTPYSVIAFPDGTLRPVSGALPYEQWGSLLTQ